MSSVEQTSTKGISFTFPVMSSVPSTDKSNFVQNPLATITGHVQVHNPAPNIAVNQQQAEITQIAPKPLSAIPMLHETLEKMMSKMTQIENTMSLVFSKCTCIQFAVLSTPQSVFETIPNSVNF